MIKLLVIAGRTAAALGVLVCVGAGISRIFGMYHLMGFEVVTWFIVGIALMLMACLAKLYRDDFT